MLCYNATLAAKLQAIIRLKKLDSKVSVRTFHGWCFDQLRLYNVAMPPKGESYFDQLVESVIQGVETGQIPRAQYGAVMMNINGTGVVFLLQRHLKRCGLSTLNFWIDSSSMSMSERKDPYGIG